MSVLSFILYAVCTRILWQAHNCLLQAAPSLHEEAVGLQRGSRHKYWNNREQIQHRLCRGATYTHKRTLLIASGDRNPPHQFQRSLEKTYCVARAQQNSRGFCTQIIRPYGTGWITGWLTDWFLANVCNLSSVKDGLKGDGSFIPTELLKLSMKSLFKESCALDNRISYISTLTASDWMFEGLAQVSWPVLLNDHV